MTDDQQLIGAAPGSTFMSSPLPMLLPPQQQQQQQQMLLCHDMGYSGQLPSAVLGPALDNAFTPDTAVQATLQQQAQQQQLQAQQQMMVMGMDAGRVLAGPLPEMMEQQMLGSNQQQQQQQVCMTPGGAMLCSNGQLSIAGSPLAQVRLRSTCL
jgi:hypothetical protein